MSSAWQMRIALLLVGAAVAAAGLVIVAIFDPKAAAAGWLVGFAFWSQVLIGSLLLVMIHRLTGGRWGEIIAPALAPATAAIPLLLVLAIPLFIAIPALYPWFDRAPQIKPDVLSRYLNMPFFIVRSLVALGGWTMLALMLPRTMGTRGQLLAAFGLLFHCLAVSSIGVDWYLSLEAPFTSSSFGASVAVIQLIAAMAWALLIAPQPEGDENTGDLGALLLAFVLGITYMDFMVVLVIWYGDLPREEVWFVERGFLPWSMLAVGAFILVSIIPIFLLMRSRVRASRTALRGLGIGVLIGVALYDAYLIAPPFGASALVPTLLALAAIGLALTGWMLGGAQALLRRTSQAHVQ
jgi:hypothetical protein